jgi:hypothetical protein
MRQPEKGRTVKKMMVAALAAVSLAAFGSATAEANISTSRALDATFAYARHECNIDRYCRQYGASRCIRHSGGASCYAWNYENKAGRKFTCKQLLFWRNAFNPEPLGGWKCNMPGWNWGPPA